MSQTFSEKTVDWLSKDALPWPKNVPVNKVDTHHHWVPPQYAQGKSMPTTLKGICFANF